MKNRMKLLKSGLVVLILSGICSLVQAQIIAPQPTLPIVNKAGLNLGIMNNGATAVSSTDPGTTVLFYVAKGGAYPDGTTITLKGSELDAGNVAFVSYEWRQVTASGATETESTTVAGTNNTLLLKELTPGYYKYRVRGMAANSCLSEEYQDVIFFVLAPLSASAAVSGTPLTGFCVDNTAGLSLALKTDVAFAAPLYQGGYANPTVDQFKLTYKWYAYNETTSERVEFTDVSSGANHSAAGATNTFTLSAADFADLAAKPGTYRFHVEVQYHSDIKDRGTRTHALWTAQVGGDTPYKLVVTPKPGRPTITIESVVD